VQERYLGNREKRKLLEIWKPDRRVRFMRKNSILRIHGAAPFRLRWTSNDWQTHTDTESSVNALEIDFVDLPAAVSSEDGCIRFTFFWTSGNRWEGQNYDVSVR
jgi:glucoamylase